MKKVILFFLCSFFTMILLFTCTLFSTDEADIYFSNINQQWKGTPLDYEDFNVYPGLDYKIKALNVSDESHISWNIGDIWIRDNSDEVIFNETTPGDYDI